jgi:geranylgeranyl pyrophosphate synthase
VTDEVARAYDDVRTAIETAVMPDSPLSRPMRTWLTDHPLPPSLLLPIAAAGGISPPAVALSASMAFLLLVMRWLDDLVDRDRDNQLWQTHGDGGAAVLSAAALTHAWACMARESTLPRDILVGFGEMTAVLALGEAADRADPPRTIAAWQRTAWRKTAVCFRHALWAGARLTSDPRWPDEAATYGTHLGLYLQAVDDIQGTFAGDAPDLRRGGTHTLPLVELMPEMADAGAAFARRDVDVLLAAMDAHDVRRRCEARAAAYARQARAALDRCLGPWTAACAGLLPALSAVPVPVPSSAESRH